MDNNFGTKRKRKPILRTKERHQNMHSQPVTAVYMSVVNHLVQASSLQECIPPHFPVSEQGSYYSALYNNSDIRF